ncbi:hypothetical protein WICMUC_000414 [Wickerhamomyces mucosus]|uniref:Probable transporter MCH1 n=1 Tax=Wickerhamomyces mucosus TaxID=1378264 RepID=A0A9P8PY62_9ASCO|nr:hypothetical protein WICMUC_000414 [Wickerhamomyces mucosus]
MYLPLPLLGYLADSHGPVILAVLSFLFFSPSYWISALYIQKNWSYWVLALSFGFIGLATSSLYFASLLTCAKLYPKNKGLTISVPVTCYGLSSLIGSQILKLKFLKDLDKDELNLFKVFKFFAWIYLILGGFNWISSSVVTIEKKLILRTDEELSLLDNEIEVNHRLKYLKFLKDPAAYVLLLSILLTIGPSEMYITNMGSIVSQFNPTLSISDQVSLHAVSSTFARLSVGGLSDYLFNRLNISRVYILLTLMVLGILTQVFLQFSDFFSYNFQIISILSGFTYGGLFTLFPTIVLSIWGSELFGSCWGSFMVAPAIGGSGFNMIFAHIFESNCLIDGAKGGCLGDLFKMILSSFVGGAVLIILLGRIMEVKKGISL